MPKLFWTIREILAQESENPNQYNLIQRFFGSENMWKNFVDMYILPLQVTQILDIGCGTAEVLPYLSTDCSYIGIDSNQAYIRSSQAKYPTHRFIQGDWNSLEKRVSKKPELILCLGLLHHLDDSSASSMLKTCYQLLETGGRIISLDGTMQEDSGRLERIFYQVDRGRFIRSQEEYAQLFPQKPTTQLHKNWLRIPYRYTVCQLIKA
jgi:SAM-dependent methyltransferase